MRIVARATQQLGNLSAWPLAGVAVWLLGSTDALGDVMLPPVPLPLHAGEVVKPTDLGSPSTIWHAQGAWLDDTTIASGVFTPDEVLIMRTDGTVLERISNPDNVNSPFYYFGAAVAHLDDTLFVLAARVTWTYGPVLYAFRKSEESGHWQVVRQIPLGGNSLDTIAATARIAFESKPGGLADRRIVVSCPGRRVFLLTPTGSGLDWSVTQTVVPYVAFGVTPDYDVSFQGDTIALTHTGSDSHVCLLRVDESHTPVFSGALTQSVDGGPYGHAAVLSDGSVLVGQPQWLGGGRVQRLKYAQGEWVQVETVAWPFATPMSRWGSCAMSYGDSVVVSCPRALPTGMLAAMFHLRPDGTLVCGPMLRDATAATTSFVDPIHRMQVTGAGGLVLETQGLTYPIVAPPDPWQFVHLAHAFDLDQDGLLDAEAIAKGVVSDCNANGVPDMVDLSQGLAEDADGNLVPDRCQADCDLDGVGDYAAILGGAMDCNANGVPDACEVADGAPDADGEGMPDGCGEDCNGNGVSDMAELAAGDVEDCDGNGVPDTCDAYAPPHLPSGLYGAGYGMWVWYRVDPARPVVRALDVVFADASLPLVINIVRDRSGVEDSAIVQTEDVLLHQSLAMPPLPPPGPDGLRPPVRIAIGQVDLSSAPAFWVRVTNARQLAGEHFGPLPTDGMTRYYDGSLSGLEPDTAARMLRDADWRSTSWSMSVRIVAAPCLSPADLDADGRVNGADLGLLLQRWGCVWCEGTDLDGNGVVAGGDLAILLAEWNP
jgi:hypothetical protein